MISVLRTCLPLACLIFLLGVCSSVSLGEDPPPPTFRVPEGFVVERVAGPPLVRYPLFACFDNEGRLYVAEGTGTNLPGPELVPRKLSRITRLVDSDGDGVFDEATTFADNLIFAQGVLWHDGVVYCCSHPSLWRLEDTDDDGVADRRDELVTGFRFSGNGCDIHGPFLGPDGWLYWADGRHGYRIEQGERPAIEGFAARIFRCRTDGSHIERIAGGGFDNPVELVFTPEGDLIGTMDQGPGDCLLHYVEGGVYPMEHACLSEFAMTGPMLGAVRQYSAALPVALCGMARYRSTGWGEEFQDALFSAQFNVHRIERHRLVRDGSTYRSEEMDFMISDDSTVHFSDVLEDADGSLLVVDMGAWFNYGCPTSKIARPEVLGAIYRVRRNDARNIDDPWGNDIRWNEQPPQELTVLLDDPRPMVRDRAIALLAKDSQRITKNLDAVVTACSRSASAEARRNAVWTLCRIGSPAALEAARQALEDVDPSVRQAAIHTAGLHRDHAAIPALAILTTAPEAELRRAAAEALGRIGGADAVAALLGSLRLGSLDRFLEHSLVYALIRINDRSATLPALADPNPRVRQAALVALDQMPNGELLLEQIVPLLETEDPDLRQAALDIFARHPHWAAATTDLLSEWLTTEQLTDDQRRSFTGALIAFAGQAEVQRLVADGLSRSEIPHETRLLLLRVVGRTRADAVPPSWLEALGQALMDQHAAIRGEAVSAIRSLGSNQFDGMLRELSGQVEQPLELRIAALECLAPRVALDSASFELLSAHVSEGTEPLARMAAARTLGASLLDDPQLRQLAGSIAAAGPMVGPLLTQAFARSHDAATGLALLEALDQSAAADAFSPDDIDRLVHDYPPEVQARAQPLRDRLAQRRLEQAAYLAGLTGELLKLPGDPERGRAVFFSKRVACYACHRVPGGEGNVGPELSLVGRFRSAGDLLESIVFPSSSIVPQFRTFQVATHDGHARSGLIVRDTVDSIQLRTPELDEITLRRSDVEEMTPSDISIMPQGLEKQVSRQELSDMLEYLYGLR